MLNYRKIQDRGSVTGKDITVRSLILGIYLKQFRYSFLESCSKSESTGISQK